MEYSQRLQANSIKKFATISILNKADVDYKKINFERKTMVKNHAPEVILLNSPEPTLRVI